MADKAKVLLIDDDPDVLDTTKLFLEKRNMMVSTAASPEEATRRLEEQRPDVVVLDVMMPDGTEGFHWLYDLRRHTDMALREVPVIVLTSIHSTTDLRFHEGDADETGRYLPAQLVLDKPVDPDVLAEKINGLVCVAK